MGFLSALGSGISSIGSGIGNSFTGDGMMASLMGDGTMSGSPLMGLGNMGVAGMGVHNAKQGQKDMMNLAGQNQAMQQNAYDRDKERQDATSKLRF